MPIMLRSDRCVLHNKSDAEMYKMKECPLDPGKFYSNFYPNFSSHNFTSIYFQNKYSQLYFVKYSEKFKIIKILWNLIKRRIFCRSGCRKSRSNSRTGMFQSNPNWTRQKWVVLLCSEIELGWDEDTNGFDSIERQNLSETK